MSPPIVTMLTDSRGFDTYYTNSQYGNNFYGYDKTFPFLVRKNLLADQKPIADLCHIPDHFRSGSVQNNILRLALTDPAVVVLLDGIWETLLNKEHFNDWVSKKIGSHDWKNGDELELTFSSRKLADLFINNELSVSPNIYAERISKLISFFRRRGRQCLWLTTPVTPFGHKGGTHYAGGYLTFPDWGACIEQINKTVTSTVLRLGGSVIDLDALMVKSGGADKCLIDQWHFSELFHDKIAGELITHLRQNTRRTILDESNISHRFMVNSKLSGDIFALVGNKNSRDQWKSKNSQHTPSYETSEFGPIDLNIKLIILCETDLKLRDHQAIQFLDSIDQNQIIVFANEVGEIRNPIGVENFR